MTPTTNKLVRLNDVMKVMNSRLNIPSSIFNEMQSLPTYPEPMEYKLGEFYEFSDDGERWEERKFLGYVSEALRNTCRMNYIRPITPISPDITSAIALLEATGEYVIIKI